MRSFEWTARVIIKNRLGEQSKPERGGGALPLKHNKTQTTRVEILGIYRGSPIQVSVSGISLIWRSGFGILKQNRGGIRDQMYAREGFAGDMVPNITLGITGLQGIFGRDYGIEEPYWGPSKHKTINLMWRENDLLQTNNKLKQHMAWTSGFKPGPNW